MRDSKDGLQRTQNQDGEKRSVCVLGRKELNVGVKKN